jgi:hypothetical protein
MSRAKLTDEQAADRLAWLAGPAGVEILNCCYSFPSGTVRDPLPVDAIEKLHEMSRVAATVAKHYEGGKE